MDEKTRKIAARKGLDRTIPDSGVLPEDIVELWSLGEIPLADACARLRAMPDFPEPVVDVDAFATRLEVLERYDELRGTAARFWILEEGAGRIAECECGPGASVVTRHSSGPSREVGVVELCCRGAISWWEAMSRLGVKDEAALRRDIGERMSTTDVMAKHGIGIVAVTTVRRQLFPHPGYARDDHVPHALEGEWLAVMRLLDRYGK